MSRTGKPFPEPLSLTPSHQHIIPRHRYAPLHKH